LITVFGNKGLRQYCLESALLYEWSHISTSGEEMKKSFACCSFASVNWPASEVEKVVTPLNYNMRSTTYCTLMQAEVGASFTSFV
jgi:hypothetical protein